MKPFLMVAALMLGTAAAAQTTDPATDTETNATTTTTMATGQTVAPDNSAPERDARGIAVVSAPATAPAGYNEPAHTMAPGEAAPPAGPAPTQGTAGPLPPCTRTVTDHCTQTYERHRSPS
jgi:hypothetical protein